MINQARKGFTLIEILIVVAIIAILASVVLVGLGPTQQAGRDARRLSDLRETQNGLELYFNKCGYYPGATVAGSCAGQPYTQNNAWGATNTTGMRGALTGSNIGVTVVPNDPTSGVNYQYGTTAGGASYIIAAKLENANNSVFNTYTAPNTAGYTGITSCASPNYCISL